MMPSLLLTSLLALPYAGVLGCLLMHEAWSLRISLGTLVLFLFGSVGSDYIVVCKRMEYKFLRPCVGPAVYDIVPLQDLDALIRKGGEFNIDLEMDIRQQVKDQGKKKRVGKCMITFHCAPKAMMKARMLRKKAAAAALPDAN
jgi:hypothetical protein